MDIVHHGLIGSAGFVLMAETGLPAEGLAFLAGSVFPDLDVFFMLFGKRAYLKNHQAITHSLVVAPIYAALIALLVVWGDFNAISGSLIVAGFSGLAVHIALDFFNTFRVAMLQPLTNRRFSLDAVFFIDSVSYAMTAGFYLGQFEFGWINTGMIYGPGMAIYFISKLWLRRFVGRKLDAEFLIPSAWNPFSFFVLEIREQVYDCYLYNILNGKRSREESYKKYENKFSELLKKSQVYHDMLSITRALAITEVVRENGRLSLKARDLAVRNFGGSFAETKLVFDQDGELISEKAKI